MPEKHHVPWLTILFAIIAIIFLIGAVNISQNAPTYSSGTYGVAIPTEVQNATNLQEAVTSSMGQSASYLPHDVPAMPPGQTIQSPTYTPNYYYQNGGQPNVTDTREFNKTNYRADMRSRDVQGVTKKVETTVRGYGGRVDQIQSSPKMGYVSFVVPADKFDNFRDELENLVDSRFLSVNIQSENLLPQKQGIEGEQSNAQQSLDSLNTSKTNLTSAHNKTINSLQSQLDTDTSQIASLQAQTTTDASVQAQNAAAIQTLVADQKNLRTRIANENSSYSNQLSSLNAQITWAQSRLGSADTQNQNLLDNVATVNGSVSITWINVWEVIQLYVPAYWFAIVFGLFALGAFILHRRGKIRF